MTTRVAVVTGAAQGIGEAIALRLAHDGFDVAILDIRGKEEQMQAVAQKINDSGRRSQWIVGDVSDESSVKDAVESVVQTLGGLDVVHIFTIGYAVDLFQRSWCLIPIQMVANAGFVNKHSRTIVECMFIERKFHITILMVICIASTEEWDAIFAVHARGTMLSFKYAAIQMIKQGRGGRLIGQLQNSLA